MCIGQFSVAGVVPVVIAGNAVSAYRVVAPIVALALIGFQMLTAFGIKERDRREQTEKLSLKDMYGLGVLISQASGIYARSQGFPV